MQGNALNVLLLKAERKTPIKKVLIIRFSSIGDIVLTTPIVRCIKKQLNAKVHYLTKDSYKSIVTPNPFVDKVYTISSDVKPILGHLRKEDYDLVIDLHKNFRSWRVKRALGTRTIAFDKINYEKWLMVRFKKDRLPDTHLVDRYFSALRSISVKDDGLGLNYFIPKEDKIEIPKFLKENGVTTSFGNQYIAIAIGAAHNTKKLPNEKLIEICTKIKIPVILLGGPSDKKNGDKIKAAVGAHVINSAGKLSVHQSASIIQQATKVISHDTGMMHIAAAFQKELISVWGNTIPKFGFFPYYGSNNTDLNTTMEVEGLSCRPCSKLGRGFCPKGHFKCMKQQDIPQIRTQLGDFDDKKSVEET